MPVAHANELDALDPSPQLRRSRGEDAVPARGHDRSAVPSDFRQVHGWGVDLDPENRPMVPQEFPSNVNTARGEVRDRQVPHSRIHISNEQPDLTPVFGTSSPPRGLSGKLRDYAYEYGEGTNRHWMTLLLADRIDMIESMIRESHQKDRTGIETPAPANFFSEGSDQERMAKAVGAAALGALTVGAILWNLSNRRG